MPDPIKLFVQAQMQPWQVLLAVVLLLQHGVQAVPELSITTIRMLNIHRVLLTSVQEVLRLLIPQTILPDLVLQFLQPSP